MSAASVRERARRATKLLGLSAVAFSMLYFTFDAWEAAQDGFSGGNSGSL